MDMQSTCRLIHLLSICPYYITKAVKKLNGHKKKSEDIAGGAHKDTKLKGHTR